MSSCTPHSFGPNLSPNSVLVKEIIHAADAAQRAAEAELAVNEVGLAWKKAWKEPLSYCVGITEYTHTLVC